MAKNLMVRGISFEASEAARDWLGEKGYDEVFGARPLRRVIQNEVEDTMSEAMLEGRFGPGDTVHIDVQAGEIVLTKIDQPVEELASST
jgi:ATP-dependent Clp protease ATP-binding subunit ClpA